MGLARNKPFHRTIPNREHLMSLDLPSSHVLKLNWTALVDLHL